MEPTTWVLTASESAAEVVATAVEGTELVPQTTCERLVSPIRSDGNRTLIDPRADDAWLGVLDASGRRVRLHVGRGLLLARIIRWTLPPGDYTLEGQAPGGERTSQPFTVARRTGTAQPSLRLEVRLP